MTFSDFIQSGLPALGAIVALGWFFWQRYQSLERRFRQIEAQHLDLAHKHELARQAVQGTLDSHNYLINANRELIEHRTNRFKESLGEVKGWLDANTAFVLRDRD